MRYYRTNAQGFVDSIYSDYAPPFRQFTVEQTMPPQEFFRLRAVPDGVEIGIGMYQDETGIWRYPDPVEKEPVVDEPESGSVPDVVEDEEEEEEGEG